MNYVRNSKFQKKKKITSKRKDYHFSLKIEYVSGSIICKTYLIKIKSSDIFKKVLIRF